MGWDFRRGRWVAVVVIFVAITATIYVTSYTRPGITKFEAILRDFTAPVAGGITRATRTVQDMVSAVWNLRNLTEANRRLQTQVQNLQMRLAVLEGYERQVRILRRALRFQEDQGQQVLAAEVVGREPVSWHNYILINRGVKDGVSPGMAVVAPGGVVGQVRTATTHTSEVMLLLDYRSAIGGRLQGKEELVLVEGQTSDPDKPVVRTLVRDSGISVGDVVVTSGLSQVFPGGLTIGTIVDVNSDPYGSKKTGILQPGVDFAQLEVVFVLVQPTEGS